MTLHAFAVRTAAVCLLLALGGCGGGGGGGSVAPTPVTTPPAPAAVITAAGEGTLVFHPSLDTRFALALETPIRIRETAGGSADWNFARMQLIRGGREIERHELGSDVIRAAGFSRITPNSNQLIRVYFRFNTDEVDDVIITLGFGDLRDGRQFTVTVVDSFSDFAISPTPALVPPSGTVRSGNP